MCSLLNHLINGKLQKLKKDNQEFPILFLKMFLTNFKSSSVCKFIFGIKMFVTTLVIPYTVKKKFGNVTPKKRTAKEVSKCRNVSAYLG